MPKVPMPGFDAAVGRFHAGMAAGQGEIDGYRDVLALAGLLPGAEREDVEATNSGPGAPYPEPVSEKPDLVTFLTARYDEIEAAAKAAGGQPWLWHASHPAEVLAPMPGSFAAARIDATSSDLRVHITRNDPAYVLADIAAKREMLAEHAAEDASCRRCYDSEIMDVAYDPETAEETVTWPLRTVPAPCRTVRLLAAPFASHPDYDPAWAVTLR